MRVGAFLDLRFTFYEAPTGVGKHCVEMIRGLARSPGVELCVLGAHDQLDAGGSIRPEDRLAGTPASALPFSFWTYRLLWGLVGIPSVDREELAVDWIYCPQDYYVPTRRALFAATFHGAHYWDRSLPAWGSAHYSLARRRLIGRYRRICRHADTILTVSEFLKSQLEEWFSVDPGRVVVVGNGVEPEFFAVADGPCRPRDRPFVLCVGGLNYLDGAQFILPVAEELARVEPDIEILIAGLQHEKQHLIRARQLANVRLLGYVPSGELARLMHDSVALLYLSRYETFGIAAAEAMAAGAPVIASRFTAIPETVGDAGLLVDASKAPKIARDITELARNEASRRDLVARGLERSRSFTWDACVARLLGALQCS